MVKIEFEYYFYEGYGDTLLILWIRSGDFDGGQSGLFSGAGFSSWSVIGGGFWDFVGRNDDWIEVFLKPFEAFGESGLDNKVFKSFKVVDAFNHRIYSGWYSLETRLKNSV